MNFNFKYYIVILIATLILACDRDETTIDTKYIIKNYIGAVSGGAGFPNSMRLQIEFPDHEYPVQVDIQRPNRLRTAGGEKYIMVFDGKQAGYLKGAPGKEGRTQGSKLVPQEEWKDFEVDMAWYMPAFLDFPTTFSGTDTIDGSGVYKLETVLPLGGKMQYFIGQQNFQIKKITAEVEVGGKKYFPHREFSDYQTTGGFHFPRAFNYSYREEQGPLAKILSIEFNAPFPENHFSLPAIAQDTSQ